MKNMKEIIDAQREYFFSEAAMPVEARIQNLKALRNAIISNEAKIEQALYEDLGKSEFEAYETEIGVVLDEIRYLIRTLPGLAKPKRVKTPATHFPSSTRLYREPYGVVLIMAPWNYPFNLSMMPLAGAIAGGNCAVLKTSASSPKTSKVIADIISETFSQEYIAVIEGTMPESRNLLDEKYDLIFFTGSVGFGRTVMKKAAANLTPVVLELGGKSPCIVDETADLELAARRILWGKSINAGQTCVAPDYVIAHSTVKSKLIEEMKKAAPLLIGPDATKNRDYPKIVNKRHFLRLCGLIDREKMCYGGEADESTGKIGLTILDNISWDDRSMEEEIFGPILPVMEYDDLNKLISDLQLRPKPLALYLFTENSKTEKEVMTRLSFGGGCVNDTIMHVATNRIPFGGVGDSGMGAYHGRTGFETFTHGKGIVKKPKIFDLPLRYPPYGGKMNLLKKFLH